MERENSSEQEPVGREPWQMSYAEFEAEYEQLMGLVATKERDGHLDPADPDYRPLTDAERELHARDWRAFSRQRGYSDEDIKNYDRWLTLSGQRDDLPGAINDPWRRSRSSWAKQLYLRHIEHALTKGIELSPEVALEYQNLKESQD